MIGILACELTQREALLEIFETNGGTEWVGADLWNTFIPICFWQGIECNQDNVQYINLKNFGLTGTLPDVLDCFAHLKSINIEHNMLDGPLPQSICDATHLQNLEATNAGLRGEIPACLWEMPFL